MTQRLAGLVRWDSVVFVQRFRSRAADAWFMYFPLLGNEMQYVLGIPPLAWFVHDAAVLRRFTLFGAIACFVANGLKGVFKLPRPPLKLHVGVGGANHDLVAQQYGFPSTHSAHALVLAWVLAREFELTPGAAAAAIALHTAHVCVSRLYVGVHSLADVVRYLVITPCLQVGVHWTWANPNPNSEPYVATTLARTLTLTLVSTLTLALAITLTRWAGFAWAPRALPHMRRVSRMSTRWVASK